MSAKFPRIFHLPFSPGVAPDDERMGNISHFINEPLVLTEKMDGANVCMTRDTVYARSHAGPAKGPMFDRLKAIHAEKRWLIPSNVSVFCEWCMFIHSIEYTSLPDPPLFIIGVRQDDDEVWSSFQDVEELSRILGLMPVPEISRLTLTKEDMLRKKIEEVTALPSFFGGQREGIVVRHAESITVDQFEQFFAKYVRKGFKAGEVLEARGLIPHPVLTKP